MLETVDPKYTPYIKLYFFLNRLNILGVKKHTYPMNLNLISGRRAMLNPQIQGHWIQMAITSLQLEYLEFVPYKERDEIV